MGPESHAAAPIVEGWFNIELGKTVALPAFSSPPYYLQLTVNGEALSPRLKLASVPSSLRAQTAESVPADDDWATNGSNIYRMTGNVGIGDATPDGRLDVQSTLAGAAIIATAMGSTAWGVAAMAFGTTGTFYGVSGEAQSDEASSCYGVYRKASGSGSLWGVFGERSGSGTGVQGGNTGAGNWGALGAADAAVIGHAPSTATLAGRFDGKVSVDGGPEVGTLDSVLEVVSHDFTAIKGRTDGHSPDDGFAAVEGISDSEDGCGVSGSSPSVGVYASNRSTYCTAQLAARQAAVSGYATRDTVWAGRFTGSVYVGDDLDPGAPTAMLDVGDLARILGSTWPSAGTGKSLELACSPSSHRGYVQVYDRDSGGGWGQLYLGDGNVGIGGATDYSHDLDVVGNIQCVDLLETSDERLKTDVRTLEGVLDALEGIRGVSFEWNDEAAAAGATSGERGIGVLAGEVKQAFPELVSSPRGSYKSVDYTKLTAVLIEAVKELREKNRAPESQVAELEGAVR